MRKAWNHVINLKEEVYAKKRKNILCLEKKEVMKFIQEQTRKGYIQLSKSLQIALVFFVGKKDRKKRMI